MRSASIRLKQNAHYRGGIEQGGYAPLYIPRIGERPEYTDRVLRPFLYTRSLYPARRKTLVDLVLEKARRRRCSHELAMDFGRNSTVLDQPAVAELDLQNLRLGVVADRADLARVDAFSLHGQFSDTVTASPERTEASCRGSASIIPRTLQRL